MILDEIILATNNKGKVAEFSSLLSPYFKKFSSLSDFDDVPQIVESGKSFCENSLIKARTICNHFNKIALADDSGLVVYSLGGAPGIYSARYAGENATDEENIDKLLLELKGKKDRKAKFVCCLALVYPDGKEFVFEGVCEGIIAEMRSGTRGFGYDPVFKIPGFNKTMAEITSEQKNSISHRSEAVKKLIKYLQDQ